MKGRVIVENFVVHAHHGWFEHERESGRKFAVDIALTIDLGRAAATDDLVRTVDYGAVVSVVEELFVNRRFKLLEAAAVTLVRALFDRHSVVEAVSLSIRKLQPPLPQQIDAVGIEMDVTRAEFEAG